MFKKSKAPSKLPDLTLDNISPKIKNEDNLTSKNSPHSHNLNPNTHIQENIIKDAPKIEINQNTPMNLSQINLNEKNIKNEEISYEKQGDKPSHNDLFNNKSFFKELINNLDDKSKTSKEITSWYNENFANQDIVSQMRSYWKEQKPELVIKGNELKNKIMEKADHLHLLEKQWQESYLNGISTENEIEKHEKELKNMIKEFMEITKNTSK